MYLKTRYFRLSAGILAETESPGIYIIFLPKGEHLEQGLRMLSYYSDWSLWLSRRWPFVQMRYHVCHKAGYSNIFLGFPIPRPRKIRPVADKKMVSQEILTGNEQLATKIAA